MNDQACVVPVIGGVDLEEASQNRPCSPNPEGIGIHGENRRHHHTGDESGHHEIPDWIDGHRLHGIELFGDSHGAKFCGERPADPASNHDRGQDWPDLFDDTGIDDSTHAIGHANGVELGEAFEGENHADEHSGSGDDRNTRHADREDRRRDSSTIEPGPGAGKSPADDGERKPRERANRGEHSHQPVADRGGKKQDHRNGSRGHFVQGTADASVVGVP